MRLGGFDGVHRDDSHDYTAGGAVLAWIIHDFASKKRKGALKD